MSLRTCKWPQILTSCNSLHVLELDFRCALYVINYFCELAEDFTLVEKFIIEAIARITTYFIRVFLIRCRARSLEVALGLFFLGFQRSKLRALENTMQPNPYYVYMGSWDRWWPSAWSPTSPLDSGPRWSTSGACASSWDHQNNFYRLLRIHNSMAMITTFTKGFRATLETH